jgi:YidC/Oxa1 family membrane protein insertase
LKLHLNLTGGVIERAALLKYPTDGETDQSPFQLLNNSPTRFFVHQSGLKADKAESADHYAQYSAPQQQFQLKKGSDTLHVELRWESAAGIKVIKTYVLKRGSYEVKIGYSIQNESTDPWTFHHYDQLQRTEHKVRQYFIQTFTGAAVSSPEKRYTKFTFKKLSEEPISADVVDGWAAILEHYFVSAIIPSSDKPYHYYSSIIGQSNYAVGYYGPAQTVDVGAKTTVESAVYIGPKLQNRLARVAPGLELTVDYGLLWFIGKILFWTLTTMHAFSGNWGWSIILLTCVVKLVFFPLSAAGYRSMAKMRKVQPRLMAIRDRYQNDRAALNQAMMDLYKKEKINPLGGCLPIVVQIPVFIALYWVILESVELRQAPWIFWIKDLSIKDHYFVLPVLMTISMWLQSKLNPAPVDPIQARVMQIMPFAFGIFFAFFPSGLVLYWFVNNCLSIGQQWTITRATERGSSN